MSAWRPIETAPKDGKEILLRLIDGCGVAAGYWHGGWRSGENIKWTAPTHWQPLPSADLAEPKNDEITEADRNLAHLILTSLPWGPARDYIEGAAGIIASYRAQAVGEEAKRNNREIQYTISLNGGAEIRDSRGNTDWSASLAISAARWSNDRDRLRKELAWINDPDTYVYYEAQEGDRLWRACWRNGRAYRAPTKNEAIAAAIKGGP